VSGARARSGGRVPAWPARFNQPAGTQLVSGVAGVTKNDARTCCAHGDSGITKWPTRGMTTTVEGAIVCAASRPQRIAVMLS
jgi:hypothetical protein